MVAVSETRQFQILWQTVVKQRLPHALMLAGVKGTDKGAFASYLSQAILCQQIDAQGVVCGKCHSCRLVANRAHPNILWIEPEKTGQAIKIDQVRLVTEFIGQTSLQGEFRMAIIHPADAMNTNAANALLKTLEEPSSGALLILIHDLNGRLPATIASRCQRVSFAPPSREQVLARMMEQSERDEVLQSLNALLEGKSDAITLAAQFAKYDAMMVLDFCLSYLLDMIKLQMGGEVSDLANQDQIEALVIAKGKTHLAANTELLESLRRLRAAISQGLNLNKQLVFETILSNWAR